MTTLNWPRLLSSLPRGLTHAEVATRLGTPYQQTRLAILKHGYKYTDGRKFTQVPSRKLNPMYVDWTKSNAEIARIYGMSRERVRVWRKKLGKPFVESRGRKASV